MINKQLKLQIKKLDECQAYLDFQKSVLMENCKWFHERVDAIIAKIHKLNHKTPFLPNDEKQLKKLFKDLDYFEKKAGFEQRQTLAMGAKEEAFNKAKSHFLIALDKQQIMLKNQQILAAKLPKKINGV